MGAVASQIFALTDAGRVLSLFCDDVRLARGRLRGATEELAVVPTLVALEWVHAPSLARELDEIRDALAEAASSLWPDWYITAEQRFERSRSPELEVSALLDELSESSPHASAGWLREAWQLRRAGKPPLVPRMAAAEQVRQLARALDPSRLVFVLSVESSDASSARIRGLARAAEWLAHEAQAKTLLLLPAAWKGRQELDHVAYGALSFDTAEPERAAETPEHAPERSDAWPKEKARAAEPPVHVVVGPVVGKPHPASDVEQRIAQELSADPELSALFEFNQRLAGHGGKQYLVDLVWREGRLVVELDGPEHHKHYAYVNDRDRDYRLFMSGYTTLRVSNAEVYVNAADVVAKIRNMVARVRALRQWNGTNDV